MTSDRAEMLNRIAEGLSTGLSQLWVCTCISAYKDRGLADPHCVLCEVLPEVQPLAEYIRLALSAS